MILLADLLDCSENLKLSEHRLADKVLKYIYGDEITFPIEPFRILRELGILFQLRSFDDNTSGFYIPPENDSDVAILGINKNHIVTRQRFSASHELCHHLRDRNNKNDMTSLVVSSSFNKMDAKEKFAEAFASNLLMPSFKLLVKIREYSDQNGQISLESADMISKFFGTSFESCVYTIAYRMGALSGEKDSSILSERIRKYRSVHYNSIDSKQHKILYSDIINNYSFDISVKNDNIKYKIKKNYIYNDTRIEGSNLTINAVSELLAQQRLANFKETEFLNLSNDHLEVLGESDMYDFITDLKENPDISIYDIKFLHTKLYKYSKYPEFAGKFRETNNRIRGALIDTVDYLNINSEIYELSKELDNLILSRDQITKCEYIDSVLMIHHRLTVVHPFHDGNGRSLRGFMNILFKVNELPIIYVSDDDKSKYINALQKLDTESDVTDMSLYIYQSMIDTLCELTNYHK